MSPFQISRCASTNGCRKIPDNATIPLFCEPTPDLRASWLAPPKWNVPWNTMNTTVSPPPEYTVPPGAAWRQLILYRDAMRDWHCQLDGGDLR
jgi:hypothetical protein